MTPRKFVISFHDERSRWAITPQALERLHGALPDGWELVNVQARVSSRGDGGGVPPEVLSAVRGAEIYAGFGFPRELFLAATTPPDSKLKWVHSGAAGVASLLYPEMLSSGILLTNSAGIHGPPIAETVIAMMLHFTRGLDFAVRSQSRGEWDQGAFETSSSPIVELGGLTMGILGYGGIGREVARKAHALGMRVLATRRTPAASDEYAEILAGDEAGVERVLVASDVVVIALPATPQTRGLIGARELRKMKGTAILINVSRGSVVHEVDLVDALERGAIRGAGLDVFESEPLPADSPLWQHPRVLVTPHVSATSPQFWEREADLIVENFGRYLRGDALLNLVDRMAGY